MKKNSQGGFTLIELLVVIAIIGILASVVLASLNTARAKGSDAAVKSQLSNARAQAEIFYDTGSVYTGVCAAAASVNGIAPLIAATATSSGAAVVCNDSGQAWAAAAKLKSKGTSSAPVYFCVDNTGKAIETTTLLATSTYICS